MPLPHESLNQNPHDYLMRQIANGLSTTTELIQSLSSEIRGTSVELATIKADLINVTEDVRSLNKILKEGNGTAPVLTRVALLETLTKRLEKAVTDVDASLSSIKESLATLTQKVTEIADSKKLALEDKKSRRNVMIAIITSIVALASAILAAIFG